MSTSDDILSFLDLLDLDEEIIDTRLKSYMKKRKHSTKHLRNIILLLRYKALINKKENTDCDNDEEFDFIVQLLSNLDHENVDDLCTILNLVLCLNTSKLINQSEHLLQQILQNISDESSGDNTSDMKGLPISILHLKLCSSVLDAVIKDNVKINLPFLEIPLARILNSSDDNLKIYFLTKTIPKLFQGVDGFNVLDHIWVYIKGLKIEENEKALQILSCLSDYYLPVPNEKGSLKYESTIVSLCEFWELVLLGISSTDPSIRKISVYLSKRAIDCVVIANKDLNIYNERETILLWTKQNSKHLQSMWNDYFILIDSLEEKQSNIVLPSLKLFELINIPYISCWLNAAYYIGLKHDNRQVRFKCMEYKFKTSIQHQTEALTLLEALNDLNLYDSNINNSLLKNGITKLMMNNTSFMEIIRAIPAVKWSPIPFYHITLILADLNIKIPSDITEIIIHILKVPCNNIVIRKAVIYNIMKLWCGCNNVNWKDIANVGTVINMNSQMYKLFNCLNTRMKYEEEYECFKVLSNNTMHIDLILYLCKSEQQMNIIVSIMSEKISKLNDFISRQYSNQIECLEDVIFLIHFMKAIKSSNVTVISDLNAVLNKHNKNILKYILCLFSTDDDLPVEDITRLFKEKIYNNDEDNEILLQLYKTAILFLKDNPRLDKAVLSMLTIRMLRENHSFRRKYPYEMNDPNVNGLFKMVKNIKFQDIKYKSVGRLKNIFYEITSEVVYIWLQMYLNVEVKELIDFIDYVLECGGYDCLKWILKIVNKKVTALLDETSFNMVQFINRTWNEIDELKSNNQYSPCIQEFIGLITKHDILKQAMYNNIVISYCNKLIENASVKLSPVFFLAMDYGNLVLILCELLMYCPVLRKDQRITDNISLEILNNPCYEVYTYCVGIHFNYEIQFLSMKALVNVNDTETLSFIRRFIINKTEELIRNKQRYHGNSQTHKKLLTALQHLLLIRLKSTDKLDRLVDWSLDLLVKLPHQPSVRICLEWLVALQLYMQKTPLTEELLHSLKSKQVPLTSQFFILYWIIKHKIKNNTYKEDEYNFVLEFLLSNTMVQLFNIRLHAQYLAVLLHENLKKTTKYDYTISLIEKTLNDSKNETSYVKLKADYFVNNFDIVVNLKPFFIYYLLPRYFGIDTEFVDFDFVKIIMKNVSSTLVCGANDLKKEWDSYKREFGEIIEFPISTSDEDRIGVEDIAIGTIQKKYVPWKNMSDINAYDIEKKIENHSELIVCASLIDKLPNLGGLARTSEVFGVKTYVVDSLRHLQDKQFQGLSVSAERWINIEEVRPGPTLKEYLMQKKTEGYSIVAAEQTSTSVKLQVFKFPKKTLLLLGHEKEGVPCDLLPLMDHCVEIPQQGYVRSLNVHVTGAVFVWEYARQHLL